jgi:hypothetical protein
MAREVNKCFQGLDLSGNLLVNPPITSVIGHQKIGDHPAPFSSGFHS